MLKYKALRICRESRGFTMMEMIITVAITAIFFSCVVAILPGVTKSYHKMISLNYARQIASSASENISEQLSYAGCVKIETIEGKDIIQYEYQSETRQIELGKNGIIPGLVYDDKYYMDQNVILDAKIETNAADGTECCIVTIEVQNKNDNAPILTKERAVRLYGM